MKFTESVDWVYGALSVSIRAIYIIRLLVFNNSSKKNHKHKINYEYCIDGNIRGV